MRREVEIRSAQAASTNPEDHGVGYDLVEMPPSSPRPAPTNVANITAKPVDLADQLQKLHQLHQSGAINDEEFAAAKKMLLNASAKAIEPRKQTEAKPEKESDRSNPFKEILRVLCEPVIDYFSVLNRTRTPLLIVEYVRSAEGSPSRIVKFMLGSILVTSIIDYFLPSGNAIEFTKAPLINEWLNLTFFVLVGLVNTAFFYKTLSWAGGEGSFRTTLYAFLYVASFFFPISALVEGLFKLVVSAPFPSTGTTGALIYFSGSVLAPIHGLSVTKTTLILFGTTVVFGGLLGVLFIIFFG